MSMMENDDFGDGELIPRTQGKLKDKRKGKRAQNVFAPLPEHILYDIFLKIPPRDLHSKFRFICESWNRMISSDKFILQNAINTKPELLIQVACSRTIKSKLLIEAEDEEVGFKLREFDMKPVGRVRVRPGCHGLYLVNPPRQAKVMDVLNPITNSVRALPELPSNCPHKACGSAIGYDRVANQYKVVHVYNAIYGFEIFDLGGSQGGWRRIPGPFEVYDQPYNIDDFSWSDPVSINGEVLHWYVDSCDFLISMDVSDERFSRTPLPDSDKKDYKRNYALVEMDGRLSFVHTISYKEMDVWVLEDFHRRVWVKKHSITSETVKYPRPLWDCAPEREFENDLPDLRKLIAAGCLRNGEVVVFKLHLSQRSGFGFYLYDMKRRVLRKFNMKVKANQYFIPYRSGLVSFESEKQPLTQDASSVNSLPRLQKLSR